MYSNASFIAAAGYERILGVIVQHTAAWLILCASCCALFLVGTNLVDLWVVAEVRL